MNDVFIERVNESNIFTSKEINVILNDISLYEKCYKLGIKDLAEVYKKNNKF